MGYLKDVGNTLSYHESKKHIEGVKKDGIIQFLNLFKKFKNNEATGLLWGDELEYHLVNIDPETGKIRIKLAAAEIIQKIESDSFEAQFEYGKWMIEAVPKKPYDIVCDPEPVFESITQRRKGIQKYLDPNDYILPTPVFSMLGVGDYYTSNEKRERSLERANAKTDTASAYDGEEEKINFSQKSEANLKPMILTPKEKEVRNEISRSRYVDDEIINAHPRFPTLTRNLRLRRGEAMNIKIPIFKDVNTAKEATEDEPYPGFIHMDATAFGMGNGCLQQTFAAKDLSNARYLTDQLAVIAPIMLALSAGAPIFKGKLADIDTRWSSIAQSVDDRTAEERDPSSERYIPKSRYDSISYYISESPACKSEYNDVKFPINKDIVKFAEEQAKELGLELDDRLLNHLGFLFLRDPMVIFKDRVNVDNETNTNHFENFQSTNWNSVRFKPPPSFESPIGWRVELRTAELQIKDIENASLDLFALLIVRMIQRFKLNFYIPMSKLNENFERASKQNAVINQKFWFRKSNEYESPDEYVELTIAEFINGKEQVYKGLMGWAREFYNNYCMCHEDPFSKLVEKYLSKVIDRAEGKTPTNAQWIRSFVLNHPAYKKDSIVSEEISKDLINAILKISREEKDYSDFA
eukprot:CAMPEP_0176425816 /NCGR_PEP_ID=MMETSP0127-20121128/11595_1 /TAXON_ID=938130 /ORGANISM="Platyophrya macrostoma, Strain WH" /LENGTH=636 /DNA_ID=CAMNT_0017807011 /DNA_START=33 /DNA_END=1943 /DNA_ORIENTATION=+